MLPQAVQSVTPLSVLPGKRSARAELRDLRKEMARSENERRLKMLFGPALPPVAEPIRICAKCAKSINPWGSWDVQGDDYICSSCVAPTYMGHPLEEYTGQMPQDDYPEYVEQCWEACY